MNDPVNWLIIGILIGVLIAAISNWIVYGILRKISKK